MDSPRLQTAPPPLAAILLFVAMFFSFLVAGGLAQMANVAFGLVWTELFLFFAPAWLLVRAFRPHAASWLRLSRPTPRTVALGFLCGLANYPLAAALEAVVRDGVQARWPRLAHDFDIAAQTLGAVTGWQRVVLVFAVVLVAPLCEETAFRGLIQRSLGARFGPAKAIVITAVLFGLIHMEPIGFVARTELGVLFGFLVLWTESLWASVAAHAANNLFATALYFFAGAGAADSPSPPLQLLGLALVGAALTLPLLYAVRRRPRSASDTAWTPPAPLAPAAISWAALATATWLALMAVGYWSGAFARQMAR